MDGPKVEVTVDTARARLLLKAVRRLPRDMRREVSRAVQIGGNEVTAETRRLLGSRRGRRRKGRREVSAPGEPPARQTGALARSIRMRRNRGGLSVRIVSTRFVSRFLETGTKTGLEPRPFLTRALETKRASFERRIEDVLTGVFDRLPG